MRPKDIAQKAQDQRLLSHVGKTPDITMAAQMASAVTRGGDTSVLVRVRPGVYGLRKWGRNPPGPKPPPPARPAQAESAAPRTPAKTKAPERSPDTPQEPVRAPAKTKAKTKAKAKSPARAKVPTKEKAPVAAPAPAAVAAKPSAAVPTKTKAKAKSPARAKAPVKPQAPAKPAPQAKAPVAEKAPAARASQPPAQPRAVPGSSPATAERATTTPSPPTPPPAQPKSLAPTLDTRMADALGAAQHPLSAAAIAEKLSLAPPHGEVMAAALLGAEVRHAEYAVRRPRFAKHRHGWGLGDRDLSTETLQLEAQIRELLGRLSVQAEKQIQRRIRQMPMERLVALSLQYLHAQGFSQVVTAHFADGDAYLLRVIAPAVGVLPSREMGLRIHRDPLEKSRPLTPKDIAAFREFLRQERLSEGAIITSGLWRDASGHASHATPHVLVLDAPQLSRECARLGIGVRRTSCFMPFFDESKW